jgi:DNA recombination protein RmuC
LDNVLLFITGVLSGIIVGFIISRSYSKKSRSNDGSKESFLEENLFKAEKNLEETLLELNNQKKELKIYQQNTQELSEKAAIKETELKVVSEEKIKLENNQREFKKDFEYLRNQKESLGIEIGELKEQNKSLAEDSARIESEKEKLEEIYQTAISDKENLRTEREKLNNQIAEIKEQNKSLTEESTRIESEKEKLEEIHQTTINDKERLRTEREKLNNQIAEIKEQLKSQETQTKFLEQAKADLVTQFRALSAKMLEGSKDALLKRTKEEVTEPFTKQVETLRKQVELLSKDSTEKLSALRETTINLDKKSDDVKVAAMQLTSALRSPNVKGRWGEVNLKRILEFVGLINYCDFDEQVSVETEESRLRPDCVISIPGSRRLIVDSKAPIESYLDALKATDQNLQEKAVADHLKKVRSHIDQLAKKDYSNKLSEIGEVVDGVVLYIPVEGALSMALERDPNLLEYAFEKNIILTFPTSLLAILKGFSMTIQKAEMTKNINEIQQMSTELYKRFLVFVEKFSEVGSKISNLNKSYNAAQGSYEKRLLPQAKRIAELSGQNNEFLPLSEIDTNIKEFKSIDNN